MLKTALLIAAKDLRLTLGAGRRSSGGFLPAHIALLGLLIIFLFSLAPSLEQARNPGAAASLSPALAAILFWVIGLLAQTLIFQRLYGLEHTGGARLALLTAPIPPQAVWLGKTLAGLCLLLLVQIVLCPALILLLGQNPGGPTLPALLAIALADLGLVAVGALLGAFTAAPDKNTGRAALPAILSLPLLVPLLIAAAKLCQMCLSPDAILPPPDSTPWLGILAAFDALAIGAGLILFPFAFRDE